MTDRERQLIEAYIPHPRDASLDDFDYYVKDVVGRIFKVHIVGIYPHLDDDTHYSVYTDNGKRITDFTSDSNFPMRHMYDNKQNCKDETHNWFNNWEKLRELQREDENNGCSKKGNQTGT